ncbi:MAG: hypothetical protein CL862_01135 [Cyanobium sp. NAT70]|nr:hypothetical protein [Cyanobium sp. NAT70]|tara:strand:- start:522 stop:1895 length:1374 start_codon:yes stop_codon:yes gene_type:complete
MTSFHLQIIRTSIAVLVTSSTLISFQLFVDNQAKSQELSDHPNDLPILENSPTKSINNFIGDPDWLDLGLSILNQTNGTPNAHDKKLITSSTLATLDAKIWADHWISNGKKNGFNLHIIGTQRGGDILSNEIPNKLNTQWGFGNGPIGRLSLLSLEYTNHDSFLSQVKVGKLKQSVDFTMDPVMCFYSNFGLCGWAEATPSMIQIPGNPFNTYGAMMRFGDPNQVAVKYGIYQIYPESFDTKYHGLDFRINNNEGYAQFLQLDSRLPHTPLIPARRSEQGNSIRRISAGEKANILYRSPLPPPVFKLGGWLGGGSYERVDETGYESSNNGVYSILSLPINPGKLAMDGRLFASTGLGLSQSVQDFRNGGNAGIVLAGVLPSRPFDTLSFGYSYATYNHDYQSAIYRHGTEHALELNYNISITPNLELMPNLQLIMQPEGDESASAVFVGGLQATLSF